MDARILADLLRGRLVPSVHIVGRESRQIKEVLRQRCFFVRQRTMLRNRIHRLLGAQHEVKLPQCSDLFGCKGLSFLEKLELPAPARLLLTQQLALLKELAVRIHEDEKALAGLLQETPALNYVRSLPGMGPILATVVVSEIDGIERFPSAQKLCGYAGLCPSTHSSGGKTFQGKLLRRKWLAGPCRGGLGCHRLLGLLRDFYKTSGKGARITWQLLTQRRAYTSLVETQYLRSQPAKRIACAGGLAKEVHRPLKDPSDFPRRRLSPAAPE